MASLRDMVARSLMLELHRAGLIVLPAQRFCPPNNAAQHRAPASRPWTVLRPLECTLAELGPLEIRQVRRTPEEKLFGSLMEAHHYLGYHPTGRRASEISDLCPGPARSPAWPGLRPRGTWGRATDSLAGPRRSAEPRFTCWPTTRAS